MQACCRVSDCLLSRWLAVAGLQACCRVSDCLLSRFAVQIINCAQCATCKISNMAFHELGCLETIIQEIINSSHVKWRGSVGRARTATRRYLHAFLFLFLIRRRAAVLRRCVRRQMPTRRDRWRFWTCHRRCLCPRIDGMHLDLEADALAWIWLTAQAIIILSLNRINKWTVNTLSIIINHNTPNLNV